MTNEAFNIQKELFSNITGISAFGSLLLLAFINVIHVLGWLFEHLWRNYCFRYEIRPGHNNDWIKEKMVDIVNEFVRKTHYKAGEGSLYCFQVINRGTTHDYIYKAELDNGKGVRVDISVNSILKGSKYEEENLPHGLMPLQGEVWFVAAKNNDFKNIKNPIIIIYSAMRIYKKKIGDGTYIIS